MVQVEQKSIVELQRGGKGEVDSGTVICRRIGSHRKVWWGPSLGHLQSTWAEYFGCRELRLVALPGRALARTVNATSLEDSFDMSPIGSD